LHLQDYDLPLCLRLRLLDLAFRLALQLFDLLGYRLLEPLHLFLCLRIDLSALQIEQLQLSLGPSPTWPHKRAGNL
jgi:hypothetical protein